MPRKSALASRRGQVLNVRDATLKQMMANEASARASSRRRRAVDAPLQEIQNLIKIIGLDLNRESRPRGDLPYLAAPL